MGTVGYMSPEQAAGRPLDYRSDQFALGLVMYELVTRTRPFERATTAQTLAATIDEDPAPIDALNPEAPAHLAAIVSRCLAKDPADRYDSTRDLARDLHGVTEGGVRRVSASARREGNDARRCLPQPQSPFSPLRLPRALDHAPVDPVPIDTARSDGSVRVAGNRVRVRAALRGDPELPLGYFALGSAYSWKGMDAQGRQAFLRALELDPNNVVAMHNLSGLELWQGQVKASVERTKALTASSGANEEVKSHHANIAFLTDAPDLETRLLALLPHAAASYSTSWETPRLRYAYAVNRRGDAASAAGLIADAERVARDRIDAGDGAPALRVELAAVATLRKDAAAALGWLERAFEAGYRDYGSLQLDPILSALRDQPGFNALMERMRRDVDAQRARAARRGLLDLTPLLRPVK